MKKQGLKQTLEKHQGFFFPPSKVLQKTFRVCFKSLCFTKDLKVFVRAAVV